MTWRGWTYVALLSLPAWPGALLTVWIVIDMLADEPPRYRWASDMEPLELSEDRR